MNSLNILINKINSSIEKNNPYVVVPQTNKIQQLVRVLLRLRIVKTYFQINGKYILRLQYSYDKKTQTPQSTLSKCILHVNGNTQKHMTTSKLKQERFSTKKHRIAEINIYSTPNGIKVAKFPWRDTSGIHICTLHMMNKV